MLDVAGVIFDLDGVLVRTDRYHFLAWKTIAEQLGIPFDARDNDRLRGVGRMESLEILLERYEGDLPPSEREELAEKKNGIYRRYLEQLTPSDLTDGARQTIETLRARGYRLAVGSSSKNARLILERTGVCDAWDAIVDGTAIHRGKPDPEVFMIAAKRLNLEPCRCAVVEDASSGITAAKLCGMTAIGMGPAAKDLRADLRIGTLSDLLDVLVVHREGAQ